jgi:hypothetical protein
MKRIQVCALVLLLAMLALAALTTAPATAQPSQRPQRFVPMVEHPHLLKNRAVSGPLADGGTFEGTLSITAFGYDQAKGLTTSGVLDGVATTADGSARSVQQTFTGVPATLNETSGASIGSAQQQVCDILFLDLGPLHLDLLGLTVDLSQIVLDINAVPGAGNLLGNLLCAIAGLLDPNGLLSNLIGGLTQLLNLLNQLNQVL